MSYLQNRAKAKLLGQGEENSDLVSLGSGPIDAGKQEGLEKWTKVGKRGQNDKKGRIWAESARFYKFTHLLFDNKNSDRTLKKR